MAASSGQRCVGRASIFCPSYKGESDTIVYFYLFIWFEETVLRSKFPASTRRISSRERASPLSSSASITIRTGAPTTFAAVSTGPNINSFHCLVMSVVCLSSFLSRTAFASARRMIGSPSTKSLAIVVNIFSCRRSASRVRSKQKKAPGLHAQ